MSLSSLKRDVRVVKRVSGIDPDWIKYNEALARHKARLDVQTAAKIVPVFDQMIPHRQSDESSISPAEAHRIMLCEKAMWAKELLCNDTPELWRKDQAAIDASRYKHSVPSYTKEIAPPYGNTPEEMWDHFLRSEEGRREKEMDEGISV